MEYVFVAQHRENWANVGALKNSLADVSYFALEVSKKMDMRYMAPPMPINLKMVCGHESANVPDLQQQMNAQVLSQSDRLSQPILGSSSQQQQQPTSSPRSPGGGSQQYNFDDIEAMFSKNQ